MRMRKFPILDHKWQSCASSASNDSVGVVTLTWSGVWWAKKLNFGIRPVRVRIGVRNQLGSGLELELIRYKQNCCFNVIH